MAKAVLLVLTTFSTGALAQVAPTPDAAADPGASAITVTATRTPTPIDQVASSVTVLDKAAMQEVLAGFGVDELGKQKVAPKPNVNITIQRIEVQSDDPDRYAFGLVEAFQDAVRNPSGAAKRVKGL